MKRPVDLKIYTMYRMASYKAGSPKFRFYEGDGSVVVCCDLNITRYSLNRIVAVCDLIIEKHSPCDDRLSDLHQLSFCCVVKWMMTKWEVRRAVSAHQCHLSLSKGQWDYNVHFVPIIPTSMAVMVGLLGSCEDQLSADAPQAHNNIS